MKDLKDSLTNYVIDLYPHYQVGVEISFNQFTTQFPGIDRKEIWNALLSLQDENKVQINDGLLQDTKILPGLYS